MKSKIYVFLFIICSLYSNQALKAQDDYKYEIGGMAGTSFYMGDANKTSLYKDPGLAAGIVFRYNMDLRWSVKTNFVIGRVSGDTKGSQNAYPFDRQSSFSRNFYELGSQIELNFFSYSDKFSYLGTRRFSPYFFTGVGITFGSGERKFFDANIPMGIGLKYKIKDRLNLGFEFSFRKLFSDSFDVTKNYKVGNLSLEDPYDIQSSAIKNKDWYSLTMITLTWDFGLRTCPCLNTD